MSQETIMAMSKVDKCAAMVEEKQAASVTSRSNNSNWIGCLAIHNLTATTAPNTNSSSYSDLPVANEPILTPATAPRQINKVVTFAAQDERITPAPKQQQQKLQGRRAPRRLTHNEDTAHLFNNAGLLIPSIPGIDPVTERLFDKGEIMSLGPSRARDNYYPDGEPVGGSFVLEYSNAKKQKRDREN